MSATLDDISRRLREAVDVGESVILTNHREGIVRYKGALDGKSGIFYGVELTKGTGKNDGVYKGKARYFTCQKPKGIFVDKKQILYKKSDYIFKKRASLSTSIPVTYHCEFMKRMYGVWHHKKGIDPIDIVLRNHWDEFASKTTNWKEKWQLLKELMRVICGDEYGKFDLPVRFVYNPHYEKVLVYLVDWLKNEKHLGLRKHILKILVPFCKSYPIAANHGNTLAKALIQKQWKETKYGFRALVTRALFAVYYAASDCALEDWMPWLQRCLQSKSDVRIQAWNLLSDIALLASNNKNTAGKQKALLDIEKLLCDGKVIQLFKRALSSQNHKVMIACAEFIFGSKYILADMKSIYSVYCDVKENRLFMKDESINEYCQLLVKGENAFDLYSDEVDTIRRRKLWDEAKITCDYCSTQLENVKILNAKMESVKLQIRSVTAVLNGLKMRNAAKQQDIVALRSEVMNTNKRSELLADDCKEMQIEIFSLKKQINDKQKLQLQHKQIAMDLTAWDKWNCHDILQWILSLENGRYAKYKAELKEILPMEGIRGDELHLINQHDLISFGINNVDDTNRLIQHIKVLTTNSAPMAFHPDDVDLSAAAVPPQMHQMDGSNAQQEGMV